MDVFLHTVFTDEQYREYFRWVRLQAWSIIDKEKTGMDLEKFKQYMARMEYWQHDMFKGAISFNEQQIDQVFQAYCGDGVSVLSKEKFEEGVAKEWVAFKEMVTDGTFKKLEEVTEKVDDQVDEKVIEQVIDPKVGDKRPPADVDTVT